MYKKLYLSFFVFCFFSNIISHAMISSNLKEEANPRSPLKRKALNAEETSPSRIMPLNEQLSSSPEFDKQIKRLMEVLTKREETHQEEILKQQAEKKQKKLEPTTPHRNILQEEAFEQESPESENDARVIWVSSASDLVRREKCYFKLDEEKATDQSLIKFFLRDAGLRKTRSAVASAQEHLGLFLQKEEILAPQLNAEPVAQDPDKSVQNTPTQIVTAPAVHFPLANLFAVTHQISQPATEGVGPRRVLRFSSSQHASMPHLSLSSGLKVEETSSGTQTAPFISIHRDDFEGDLPGNFLTNPFPLTPPLPLTHPYPSLD